MGINKKLFTPRKRKRSKRVDDHLEKALHMMQRVVEWKGKKKGKGARTNAFSNDDVCDFSPATLYIHTYIHTSFIL